MRKSHSSKDAARVNKRAAEGQKTNTTSSYYKSRIFIELSANCDMFLMYPSWLVSRLSVFGRMFHQYLII